MVSKVRTIDFLPEIFRTNTNKQFLSATLDQLVQQPNFDKVQGFIGSKFGYGVDANDKYVKEYTKVRTDYQLEPAVIFQKKDTAIAADIMTYPGVIDALSIESGITTNHNNLFSNEFYSYDNFVDLDKLINFGQYYWIPQGPEAVNISTNEMFYSGTFIVNSLTNLYRFDTSILNIDDSNPTLTLIRGGTYEFSVNQESQFWIQTLPGLDGVDPTHTNISTRQVFGVENNGESQGTITFTVPLTSDQSDSLYTGRIDVDIVTSKKFNEVNGKRLSELQNLDGITNLENKTIMFYGTDPSSRAFLGGFYDETPFSDRDWLDKSTSITITATEVTTNLITCDSTSGLKVNQAITFNGMPAGNIVTEETYYVLSIDSGTTFTISEEVGGDVVQLVTNTEQVHMTALVNSGMFEDGEYTTINDFFYKVTFLQSGDDPVIKLVKATSIPNNTNIVATTGTEYINKYFVKNTYGEILLVPRITANLDTLYYQDGSNDTKFGKIKLIDAPQRAIIDINEILGRKTYTSPNGIPFSNGLRVRFVGEVHPQQYLKGDYYVEGVGTSINLILSTEQTVPEPFGSGLTAPFDDESYDNTSFEGTLLLPYEQDYIVINRNSRDKNAWARSNMWFHVDVLKTIVNNSKTSPIASAALASTTSRAKRPIIEFNPHIKLFNSGVIGKSPVDYINFGFTNAFSQVSGKTLSEVFPDGASSSFFDGARIIFAGDNDPAIAGSIYVVNLAVATPNEPAIISLTKASDGHVKYNEQVVITKGETYQGHSYWYNGLEWVEAQFKQYINQPPKFDIFDNNGISLGDKDYYSSSDFEGCTLFQYAIGTGGDDSVLKFPIKYSGVGNLGDIVFESSLNTQTFNFVLNNESTTLNVNIGYVHAYDTIDTYTRKIGWETAVEKSFQYQVFNLNFTTTQLTAKFVCDVRARTSTETEWPPIVVYLNNERVSSSDYTVTLTDNSTVITLNTTPSIDTPVEILIYSDQVSKVGYFQIPSNFDHNPFNDEITQINLGDIRGHYKSICNNVPNLVGAAFGANNYRDLGDVIKYGTRIVQNSAPFVAAAAFLRKQKQNFFNSVSYNSNEYVKFKSLLVDTVNSIDFDVYTTPSTILDTALDIITSSKDESNAFFYSDMMPAKNAKITKTYTFKNNLDTSYFPLSRVYDFKNANYYGVLVYVTRIVDGLVKQIQLVKDVDYTISETEASVMVTKDLVTGDIVTIKEYDQTYGSYIPNTPTKVGLYPAFLPEVMFDETYRFPAYVLKGHDGSITKLYGEVSDSGFLIDFRDQALFEFETRIYNNLKVNAKIPVEYDDILPGANRDTLYDPDQIKLLYNKYFLNWVGLNRIDYKTQYYDSTNEYTWNYSNSISSLTLKPFAQGNWRGIYLWLYDTTTPHLTPWEMLGFSIKPTWWDNRYGVAPYTKENDLLWTDLSNGYVYNNGDPYINTKRVRPNLNQSIPVDSMGNLVGPFENITQSYDQKSFKSSWNIGDVGPAEYAYLKSSTYPFDLMALFAVTKPAQFFALGLDLDVYRYNDEFKQYLVYDRFRTTPKDIIIYGTDDTAAAHSLMNWIVDYQRQYGVDGSSELYDLIQSLDVRLTYRMAGFSDKSLLNFSVEKGTPNSKNGSLLIPDDSYSLLLYDNQPNVSITYSSIVVQRTENGYSVYGNSQNQAFFTVSDPLNNGRYDEIEVSNLKVTVNKNYNPTFTLVPYGTEFPSAQTLAMFVKGYGAYLEQQGVQFNDVENNLEINWNQMIAELLYWIQTGWEVGSTVNINPSANILTVDKENLIVQPLTIHRDNFVLNQNLVPIQTKDLIINRDGTMFSVKTLNSGDTISFFRANLSNIEHVVVFDNYTIFNDVIFNLVTGLRQQRLFVKGTKTIEWNGTLNAAGFILNQDNVEDWTQNVKYAKGTVVRYKRNYYTANKVVVQPSSTFNTDDWVKTDYEKIQKGLLPNPSTRAYESTLYYDTNRANLEQDGDLLSFSLIGYRQRDYIAETNFDDATQVSLYQNIIPIKGTPHGLSMLKGIKLQDKNLSYSFNENWAIKTGEYGGVLGKSSIEFTLDENKLVGNPSIVSLVKNANVEGSEQEVSLYNLKNYSKTIDSTEILTLVNKGSYEDQLPSAGYVNLDDVRFTGFTLNKLDRATVYDLYRNDYIWIADYKGEWDVYTPLSMGMNVKYVINNLNDKITIVFDQPHNLAVNDLFGIINFDTRIDGYHTVETVADVNSVVVLFTLSNSVNVINGLGLPFKLQSQRLSTAAGLLELDLTNADFTTNTVWIDKDVDNDWSVYQKTNNYTNDNFEDLLSNHGTYGTAVTYLPGLGYYVSDPSYILNVLNVEYDDDVTITVTTAHLHGLSSGHSVTIKGLTADTNPPNGQYVITVVDNRTFTYTIDSEQTPTGTIGYDSATIPQSKLYRYVKTQNGSYVLKDSITKTPPDAYNFGAKIIRNDEFMLVTAPVTTEILQDYPDAISKVFIYRIVTTPEVQTIVQEKIINIAGAYAEEVAISGDSNFLHVSVINASSLITYQREIDLVKLYTGLSLSSATYVGDNVFYSAGDVAANIPEGKRVCFVTYNELAGTTVNANVSVGNRFFYLTGDVRPTMPDGSEFTFQDYLTTYTQLFLFNNTTIGGNTFSVSYPTDVSNRILVGKKVAFLQSYDSLTAPILPLFPPAPGAYFGQNLSYLNQVSANGTSRKVYVRKDGVTGYNNIITSSTDAPTDFANDADNGYRWIITDTTDYAAIISDVAEGPTIGGHDTWELTLVTTGWTTAQNGYWVLQRIAPNVLEGDRSFKIFGDYTSTFLVGQKLFLDEPPFNYYATMFETEVYGIKYNTVASSSYDSDNQVTTVNLEDAVAFTFNTITIEENTVNPTTYGEYSILNNDPNVIIYTITESETVTITDSSYEYKTYEIASVTNIGTVVTVTTTEPHNLHTDNVITLEGLTATTNAPNGSWLILRVSATQFTLKNVVAAPTGTIGISSATLSTSVTTFTTLENFTSVSNALDQVVTVDFAPGSEFYTVSKKIYDSGTDTTLVFVNQPIAISAKKGSHLLTATESEQYTVKTGKYNSVTDVTTFFTVELIKYSTPSAAYIYTINNDWGILGFTNAGEFNQQEDQFGFSIATNYDGSKLFVGAPRADFSGAVADVGYVYFFDRLVEKFEVQYNQPDYLPFFTIILPFAPDENEYGDPLPVKSSVYLNDVKLKSTQYFLLHNLLILGVKVNAGDIVTLSSSRTVLTQELTSYENIYGVRPGNQFGYSLACNTTGSELMVGAPFNIGWDDNREGAVYRFTNEGKKFGTITGLVNANLFDSTYIYLNGYRVQLLCPTVTPGELIAGYNGYTITKAGTTDWISIGATPLSNVVGTITYYPGYGTYLEVTSVSSGLIGHAHVLWGSGIPAGTKIDQQLLPLGPGETLNGVGFYHLLDDNDDEIAINVGSTSIKTIAPGAYITPTGSGSGSGTAAKSLHAADIADAINKASITNVFAYAASTDDLARLVIRLRDKDNLNPVNDKLNISVFNGNYLYEMGMAEYFKTQVILEPRGQTRAQFGHTIKFNQYNSFAVSAPVSNRFVGTHFDYTEDGDTHNDTVFDNNLTQFEDQFTEAGSVYVYDYVPTYNEINLIPGQFVYSQTCNDSSIDYGAIPLYGSAISFNDHVLMVGAPDYKPNTTGGKIAIFTNESKTQGWSVYRNSSPVVDINKIQKVELYNNLDNSHLDSLDYIDPLQGKILGVVRENIDIIAGADPAGYNNTTAKGNMVWGKDQVGKIWFNTNTTRFMNYHQNDMSYNSRYWGKVFPNSTVTVYTWIESDVSPAFYTGNGTPYDLEKYSIAYMADNNSNLSPRFYYWVRNTNTVNTKIGKTLPDTILEQYIANPQMSGISYFAPLDQNSYGLFNARDFINGQTTNLHISFSDTTVDIPNHNEFKLVRTNYPTDFLPGLPDKSTTTPLSLYAKLIDSLSGEDEAGGVVPDPYLPKLLQTGIAIRPRQGLFVDRLTALKNYLQYANAVMKENIIAELSNLTFLGLADENTNTSSYWSHIYWWADGYNDNTKTSFEVASYPDLLKLTATEGLIVGVLKNSQDKREVYKYTTGLWERIGLQDGTIEFLDTLWDYKTHKLGFGDSFFDNTAFDSYPSIETRNIIRALNEQIYIGSLLEHRNKSLILMFEYIQSEATATNNYIPWLSKTSLADVVYNVRELAPSQKYQRDNERLISGFVNENKPYHVVIKEFALAYTANESFTGFISDFDLPPLYNPNNDKFQTPVLVNGYPENDSQFNYGASIWSTDDYKMWYRNYGLTFVENKGYQITILAKYMTYNDSTITVQSAWGIPVEGTITIDNEVIGYAHVDRERGILSGLTRGIGNTINAEHFPNTPVIMDLPAIVVLDSGRDYQERPNVSVYVDTSIYPAPTKEASLKAVMSGSKVVAVDVLDPGDGYPTNPEIIIDPSITITFSESQINFIDHTIIVPSLNLVSGDLIRSTSSIVSGTRAINDGYYYAYVVATLEDSEIVFITLHSNYKDSIIGENKVIFTPEEIVPENTYTFGVTARAIPVTTNTLVRGLNTVMKLDRTSYQPRVVPWVAGQYWGSPYNSIGNDASWTRSIYYGEPIVNIDPEVKGSTVSALGSGAIFTIENVLMGGEYYAIATTPGSNYEVGDTITIYGNYLGGDTPDNDCTITVESVKSTYTNQNADTTTSVSGNNAKFNIINDGTEYTVTISQIYRGTGYVVGDQLVYEGIRFDGASITNDITITVIDVDGNGRIVGFTYNHGPVSGRAGIHEVTATGDAVDAYLASLQGAVLPVIYQAPIDRSVDGQAVVKVDYTLSGLEPGQIHGVPVYFYHKPTQYVYDDTANNGAVLYIYKPRFNPYTVSNQYYMTIEDPGTIYQKDDIILIKGSNLGGVDGINDAMVRITWINNTDGIYSAEITGSSYHPFDVYYVKPYTDTQLLVYKDASFNKVVLAVDFQYFGDDYDFAYIPEPIVTGLSYKYTDSSYVIYNGSVYRCIESNNDYDFDFTKWVLVPSSSRELNALDRIIAYYEPAIDMPPKDLQQLVSGISYPHNVYYGNTFPAEEELPLDFELTDQPFYPRGTDIKSITFDGTRHVAIAESDVHSVILISTDQGETWENYKISDKELGVTCIIWTGEEFVSTTQTELTPMFLSFDAENWVTVGTPTPYDAFYYDMIGYDSTPISCPPDQLMSVAYNNGKYFAVGTKIMKSSDGIHWSIDYSFTSRLTNNLKEIKHIDMTYFSGFIAVGGGVDIINTQPDQDPMFTDASRIVVYPDSVGDSISSWNLQTPSFSTSTLYTVTNSSELIVVAGDNGEVWYSNNGYNWVTASISGGPVTDTIRSSMYGDGKFILVGDNGTILSSTDGMSWTQITGVTTYDLHSALYDGTNYYIAGENASVFRSEDGAIWYDVSFITTREPFSTVVGNDFLYGYGPEELVPGIISDSLTIKVTSNPGSTWDDLSPSTDDRIYKYTGYGVVNKIITASEFDGLTVSFDGLARNPASLSVFVINSDTKKGRRIYELSSVNNSLYIESIDWINKTITLNTSIAGNESLMIEVYEIGNGNQVYRSNSSFTPIRQNEETGYSEIIIDLEFTPVTSTPAVFVNGTKLEYLVDYNVVADYGKKIKTKIEFYNSVYDQTTDYVSYAILHSSLNRVNTTTEYGYTVPETQVFAAHISLTYDLTNDLGDIIELDLSDVQNVGTTVTVSTTTAHRLNTGDTIRLDGLYATSYAPNGTYNITYQTVTSFTFVVNNAPTGYIDFSEATLKVMNKTAVVEVNGYRLKSSDYIIDNIDSTITLASGLTGDDILAVTTFNEIKRQYFMVDYNATQTVVPLVDIQFNEIILQIVIDGSGGFVDGDCVRIDGIAGSRQLNNNRYYVKLYNINGSQYIYHLYDDYTITTDPVLSSTVEAYINGGYIWNDDNSIMLTQAVDNLIYPLLPVLYTTDVTRLWVTINGERVASDKLRLHDDRTSITSVSYNGTTITVTTDKEHRLVNGESVEISGVTATTNAPNGTFNVTTTTKNTFTYVVGSQPTGSLNYDDAVITGVDQLNNGHTWLNIMEEITSGDEVIVTSMIDGATPNSLTYTIDVNKNNSTTIYRITDEETTWLTNELGDTDAVIYVDDVTRLLDIKTYTTNAFLDGTDIVARVPANPNLVRSIAVYNNTTATDVSDTDYVFGIVDGIPSLTFTDNVSSSDMLEITVREGDVVHINNEKIRFTHVDFVLNTLSGLTRGILGTSVPDLHYPYDYAHGLTIDRSLEQKYHNTLWNSNNVGKRGGDPLQVSTTEVVAFFKHGYF